MKKLIGKTVDRGPVVVVQFAKVEIFRG